MASMPSRKRFGGGADYARSRRNEGRRSSGHNGGEGSSGRDKGRGGGGRGESGEGRSRGGGRGARGRRGSGGGEERGGVEQSSGRGGIGQGRSRRGQDGERDHRPSPLHFQKLRRMLSMDPTDAVLDLIKHEEQLQNLLNDGHIKDDYAELLLEILANVYDTHMKENLMKILALFPNTAFLQKALPRYIMMLPTKGRNARPEKHTRNIALLFEQLLRRFPDLYTEVPLDSLSVATTNLASSINPAISQQVQNLMAIRQRIIMKKSRSKAGLKKDQEAEEEVKPPDDFRQLSVHPTTDDLETDREVFLRKNIVEGKYENVDHYLDVQFRLLREDFIGPLREGVAEISEGIRRNERQQNLRIYRNVVIVDTVCTNSGIVYIIHFDVRHLKKVNWESSKRLIFGAFLCMSKDSFNTLVFATITERKAEKIKDGYLQVRFLGEMQDLQPGDRFEMVESPGYYESYCHNLKGLQELNDDRMSFSRYLVECETDVHIPKYLMEAFERPAVITPDDVFGIRVTYDLRASLRAKDAKAVAILDSASWPSADRVELNPSQLEAIQAALTKEFVVVQGPPGTGKTYVGLKIVQALLANAKYWCGRGDPDDLEQEWDARATSARTPMLIVCYTNHALDQFLEGILHFKKDGIVRVGGRSGSEILQQHNLANKARRTAAWYNVHAELQGVNKKITEKKECLAKSYNQLLGLEDMLCIMESGVADHFLPFVNMADYMGTSVIDAWLNMQPLPYYASQSFSNSSWEFEEGDEDEEEEEGELEEDEEEEEEEVGEEQAENDGKAEEEASGEHDMIDVEKDAERLQGEREFDDEYAPIESPEDAVKMGMTQEYINMVNLRARAAQFVEEAREGGNFVLPEQSLWQLPLDTRRQLYDHWVKLFREHYAREISDLSQAYDVVCEQMKEVKHGQEENTLRDASVIGMTTTGAAKYRDVLQKIQPKIVVVEEAAEVLEAHIVTALSKGTEHLILIGDHKQLKPNPSVYTLAKQYNLEVSLFERMVRNGMKCHTLTTQHRMRPEIARLMRFIYEDLRNHVSVEKYPDVLGVSKNLFFINHQYPEKSDDEIRSHSNEHEASYIVALCRYLLCQGYDNSKITVLTTYTGQLLELKKLMPKVKFSGVRVCTVDNFQGEENDIILLSLVRSNVERKIGFLAVSNRVCVALSRARVGFYCIGNIGMLAEKSELWAKIKADLETHKAIGDALPIYCRNHKATIIQAATAKDFKKAPEGGCTLPCDFRLDCGHKCEMACHPVDREHLNYVCEKSCAKLVCTLEHCCRKRCHYGDECGPCKELVVKSLEECGHKVLVACSAELSTFECTSPCEKTLSCGHPCRSQCGKLCSLTKCQEKVEKTLPCGHKHLLECSTPGEDYKCDVPCKTNLDCGHPCPGNCHSCREGRVHVVCNHPCQRTLICSHPCKEPCTKDCPPCQRDCENRCMHSACHKKCGEPCTPCQEPCTWNCAHKKCLKKCSEICDRKPCNVICRKKLQCGSKRHPHRCVGLCGEKCPKLCRVCNKGELTEIFFGTEDKLRARFIELLDCSHVFEVEALDQWMDSGSDDVTDIQLKQCPKCKTPIRKSQRYGNIIKKTMMDIESVKRRVSEDGVDRNMKEEELMNSLEKIQSKYPIIASPCEEVYAKISDRNVKHPQVSNNAYNYCLERIESCTNQELSVVENQIQLLSCIYEIKAKFLKKLPANHEAKCLCNTVYDLERCLVQGRLTSQLFDEITREIQRVGLACRVMIVEEDIEMFGVDVPAGIQSELDSIANLLSSRKKIVKKEQEEAEKRLDTICRTLGLGAVTAEEKAQIVKAIGLAKGHWFKCRNGHIYAIGECGGAMERGVCPECHEVIGGGHHMLAEGNELAPEMDGAMYAAWSDQANLENYDQAELGGL